MTAPDEKLSRMIEVAEALSLATGEQYHVVETYLGETAVISGSEFERFYMGYPNEFLFSTAAEAQKAS